MHISTTTDAGQRLTSLLMTSRNHSLAITESRLQKPVPHSTMDYQRIARKDRKPVASLDPRMMALLDDCEA